MKETAPINFTKSFFSYSHIVEGIKINHILVAINNWENNDESNILIRLYGNQSVGDLVRLFYGKIVLGVLYFSINSASETAILDLINPDYAIKKKYLICK